MTALGDWVHLVTDIGEEGLRRTRQATAEELAGLARALDVLSCERFAATYAITPLGERRYLFSGTLDAELTQACVVSLEPVPAHLSETFSIELAPADALEDELPVAAEREVSSVADVEPIEDGRIEAGAILFGVLSAALDPYPRKPGVAFDWVDPKHKPDAGGGGPFAALAKLKRGS